MASMEQVIVVSMSPDVQAEFDRIKADLLPVVSASQKLYACMCEFGDNPEGPCQEKYEHWRDVMAESQRKIRGS